QDAAFQSPDAGFAAPLMNAISTTKLVGLTTIPSWSAYTGTRTYGVASEESSNGTNATPSLVSSLLGGCVSHLPCGSATRHTVTGGCAVHLGTGSPTCTRSDTTGSLSPGPTRRSGWWYRWRC